MKAQRIHRFGGPDAIEYDDVDIPKPGPGEVLVRVGAAGVGPWDALIRTGQSSLVKSLPVTLGSDLAGTVESVGSDVAAFNVGDEVFGVTNERFIGAYGEFAVAQAGRLAKKPPVLSFVEAASVPVVAVTAWEMLFSYAHVGPAQTVVVHGASGNVGAYAVQLATLAGANVVAIAHAADLDYVRTLGAQRVVDYDAGPFETAVRGADAVIDTVGESMQAKSLGMLAKGGALVSSVSQPDKDAAAARGLRAEFFIVDVTAQRLQVIANLFAADKLEVDVGTVLALSEARTAHEMLDKTRPHPRGKIVLRVDA